MSRFTIARPDAFRPDQNRFHADRVGWTSGPGPPLGEIGVPEGLPRLREREIAGSAFANVRSLQCAGFGDHHAAARAWSSAVCAVPQAADDFAAGLLPELA